MGLTVKELQKELRRRRLPVSHGLRKLSLQGKLVAAIEADEHEIREAIAAAKNKASGSSSAVGEEEENEENLRAAGF